MDYAQKLNQLRHSVAHLVAQAVLELHPDTQLTIGPATQEGFFYDFLPTKNLKVEDLETITAKMKEIVKRNLLISHEMIDKKEAQQLYKTNPFKLELINGIPDEKVGLARQGDFYDLCKGGHVESTGQLGNFILLGLSGSYWRADKNNQLLQRISGTAFFTKEELELYLQRREDALRYDHRRLGKELDLFSFHDEGPGFPFYHPHGKTIINILTDLMRKSLEKNSFKEISTPIMLSEELWHRSGHFSHYKKNMYFSTIDETTYAIKPMNCPGAILVYKERLRSYRELPLKLSEFGLVHRHELSGTMHGLFRVREFTQDDGHIFCSIEQLVEEVHKALIMYSTIMNLFNFNKISIVLATRPENSLGTDEYWTKATSALRQAIEKTGQEYTVAEGDGAFYGPKFDFYIEDSLGRSWTCGTIQIDFFLPENFELEFVNSQGTKSRPVMIHRAIYGSFERFLGILLEHYKGKLPYFLSPVQVKILTITDAQKPYAQQLIEQKLKDQKIRVTLDETSDPISGKIKVAQEQQIPIMVVIGAKEVSQQTVSLRYQDGKQALGITVEKLVEELQSKNVSV